MRALVTGGDGFVGGWLRQHLLDEGDEVWSLLGPDAPEVDAQSRAVDIRAAAVVTSYVAQVKPDAIYHLAGVAFGPDVSSRPLDALSITVGGTINVLEAAAALTQPATVLVSGSAEVYGSSTGPHPVREDEPLAPTSLYGAVKAAQEIVSFSYWRGQQLPVIVTRAFNHIGPGQRTSFAISSFAAQLAEIRQGRRKPVIRVGTLTTRRDLTDVRDVVAAYRLLVAGSSRGEPVNVASGVATSMDDVLQALISLSGMEVDVQTEPARVRGVDAPVLFGDASRLHELTGWRPTIPLERSLADIWLDAQHRAAAAE